MFVATEFFPKACYSKLSQGTKLAIDGFGSYGTGALQTCARALNLDEWLVGFALGKCLNCFK